MRIDRMVGTIPKIDTKDFDGVKIYSPEYIINSVLYGTNEPTSVHSLVRMNMRMSKVYSSYINGDRASLKFEEHAKYHFQHIKYNWSLAFTNVASFFEKVGGYQPITATYKSCGGTIDAIASPDNKTTAIFIFWGETMFPIEECTQVASYYCFYRSKLLYLEHGFKTRTAMFFYPLLNVVNIIECDMKYPLEVLIDMHDIKITLGGLFVNNPNKQIKTVPRIV